MNLLFWYGHSQLTIWERFKLCFSGFALDKGWSLFELWFGMGANYSDRALRSVETEFESAQCSHHDSYEGDSLYCLVSRLQYGVNHLHFFSKSEVATMRPGTLLTPMNKSNADSDAKRMQEFKIQNLLLWIRRASANIALKSENCDLIRLTT